MSQDTSSSTRSQKRTNGRTLTLSAALQVLATRAAALVSDELAAAGLLRLFLKPRHFPVPEREEAWVANAREDRVEGGGQSLRLWSWGEGPTVLLVHGWEGRGSQMGAFAEPLVSAGYRAVAFDAPGHGASSGQRSSIPEMVWAVADIAHLLGGVHAVVAHSAGAAAVTAALGLGLLPPLDRLVFVAPPDDPGRYLQQVAAMLRLPRSVADHAGRRIEERFGIGFADLRASSTAPDMEVPLLILHDRGDREVPYEDAELLTSRWPGARLVSTTGLGHHRILRDPEVRRQAVEHIAG